MSTNSVEKRLFNSLMDLLDEYKFEEITVEMICQNAEVSRSTFYRKFQDKQALLLWKIVSYHESVYRLESESAYVNYQYIIIFEFMKSRKDYFRKLAAIKGQNSYEDYIFKQVIDFISIQFSRANKSYKSDMRVQYAVEMFANNVVYATIKWINSDFRESPEELTEIIFENMPEMLRPYFAV